MHNVRKKRLQLKTNRNCVKLVKKKKSRSGHQNANLWQTSREGHVTQIVVDLLFSVFGPRTGDRELQPAGFAHARSDVSVSG
jgi:hypothetical protein